VALAKSWAAAIQSNNVGAIVGLYEPDAVIVENFGGVYFEKRGRDVDILNYWTSLYAAGGLLDSTTKKSTFSVTYDNIQRTRPGVAIVEWHGSFIPFNVTAGMETFVITKNCRISSETALVITTNQASTPSAPSPASTTTSSTPTPSPPQAVSLCVKWANESTIFKGDQIKMLTAVVTGVFGDEVGSPIGLPFFDGSVPCNSRDFVHNMANQNELVNSLVAFFGSPGVLGCNQPGFPVYTGDTNMARVHQHMPITQAVFDLFVNSLVSVVVGALGKDVPSLNSDLAGVAALLNSPGVAAICNQPDCTKQGGINGVTMYQPVTCTSTTATTTAAGLPVTSAPTTVAATTTAAATSVAATSAGATTTAAATSVQSTAPLSTNPGTTVASTSTAAATTTAAATSVGTNPATTPAATTHM